MSLLHFVAHTLITNPLTIFYFFHFPIFTSNALGTFGETVEEMAAFVNRMAKEVDAVVVLVSMLAKKAVSDDEWLERCKKLLELTPGYVI